jgi:UTP--glucose-1-phosphate uridylyltransferase
MHSTQETKKLSSIRKAVVLAGGWGTRFLPFTKVVPKEMLPVGRVPAVQRVVEECLDAGFEQITVITRPGSNIIKQHFEQAPLLENYLRSRNLPEYRYVVALENLAKQITFIEELSNDGYGSGVPLLQIQEQLVQETAFAVLFADDVVLGSVPAISEIVEAFIKFEADAAVAMQKMPLNRLCQFGNLELGAELTQQPPCRFLVKDLIQRPKVSEIKSPYAVVSRLVLSPAIFNWLPPSSSDVQVDLGVALAKLARVSPVVGTEITGKWFTVGDPISYLEALQQAAMEIL